VNDFIPTPDAHRAALEKLRYDRELKRSIALSFAYSRALEELRGTLERNDTELADVAQQRVTILAGRLLAILTTEDSTLPASDTAVDTHLHQVDDASPSSASPADTTDPKQSRPNATPSVDERAEAVPPTASARINSLGEGATP
jgi:hypothetical protein